MLQVKQMLALNRTLQNQILFTDSHMVAYLRLYKFQWFIKMG